ncbi:MAG: hypothetical protein IPH83_07150 [Gammaproteobacteria bacterium]|nr:hypothetical protein [Gammaproteobacteria bacterium]
MTPAKRHREHLAAAGYNRLPPDTRRVIAEVMRLAARGMPAQDATELLTGSPRLPAGADKPGMPVAAITTTTRQDRQPENV